MSLTNRRSLKTKEAVTFDEDIFADLIDGAQSNYQEIIGQMVQARRIEGLSQEDLGEMLDLSRQRISAIESLEETDVSLLRILLISEALGITLDTKRLSHYQRAEIAAPTASIEDL